MTTPHAQKPTELLEVTATQSGDHVLITRGDLLRRVPMDLFSTSEGVVFDARYYIGLQPGGAAQLQYIDAGDTDSQDADIVTAGLQAWTAAAVSFGVNLSGQYKAQPVLKARGTFAINDELFSEDTADLIWTYDKSMFQAQPDLTGAIFQCKGWPAHARPRTSGRFAELGITDPVPTAIFRWEMSSGYQIGPSITGGVFIGEAAMTDPVAFSFTNLNQSQCRGVVIRDLWATGLRVHGTNNTDFYSWAMSSVGWQPTEIGGDGFTTDTLRVTTTAGASTTAVLANEDVFVAGHAGQWVIIETAGEKPDFMGEITVVTDARNATVAGVTEGDGSDQRISWEGIKGSIAADGFTLTLSGPTFTENVVGRDIAVWKAGSKVHTGKDVLLTRVTAQTNNVLTLAHAARDTVSNVPVAFSPSYVVSSSDDFYTPQGPSQLFNLLGFNDCQFIAGQYENSGTRPALVGLVGDCKGAQWFGSKFHGAAIDGQNFGANHATMWFDNCYETKLFAPLIIWGCWDHAYGTIMVSGQRAAITLNDAMPGAWAPGDHTALFYLDPQTTDPEDRGIHLSGTFHTQGPYWGRATQDFVRLGANGTADMLMLSGPLVQRDGTVPDDAPMTWAQGGAWDADGNQWLWDTGSLVKRATVEEVKAVADAAIPDTYGAAALDRLVEIADDTVLGNISGGTAAPQTMTLTQLKAKLDALP